MEEDEEERVLGLTPEFNGERRVMEVAFSRREMEKGGKCRRLSWICQAETCEARVSYDSFRAVGGLCMQTEAFWKQIQTDEQGRGQSGQ